MDAHVIALILLSALLHASWNALVKRQGDPLIVLASIAAWAGALVLPLLLVLPLPSSRAWPYLLVSVVFHTGYNVFLFTAYRHGDLGQVYPIARGTAPLVVAVASPWIAAETPTAGTLGGVLLITAGVGSLAFRGRGPVRERRRPVGYSLIAALFIAAYTTMDGLGARLAGTPHSYTAWLFVLDGIAVAAIAGGIRGAATLDWTRENWCSGLAGGTMSLIAYGMVIWALTLGALAPVAALRETGVIFAAALSSLVLKERFGARRLAAACIVAAGAVLLRLA